MSRNGRLHAYLCDILCKCIHACVADTTCVQNMRLHVFRVWHIMQMYSCLCAKCNMCGRMCDCTDFRASLYRGGENFKRFFFRMTKIKGVKNWYCSLEMKEKFGMRPLAATS